MKSIIFLAALFLLHSTQALARTDELVGRYYELNAPTTGTPLYIQKVHREINSSGRVNSDAKLEDASGKIILTEKAIVDGTKVLFHRMDHLEAHESYELESKDDKIIFRSYTLDGDKRTLKSESAEKQSPQFITGPSTETYIREHFTGRGEDAVVKASFGVFELERSVEFEFQQIEKSKDNKTIKMRMRPASFWLSLMVSPIYLDFDRETFALREYRGRTPVRQFKNGKWKPIDAHVVYSNI
jgi:hypothetical protein